MAYNYYESQLEKLKAFTEYPLSVKIYDGHGDSTKQLDLNVESIPILIDFLTKLRVQIQKKGE